MKKLLALVLALAMVVGLAACGNQPVETTPAPTQAATEAPTQAPTHDYRMISTFFYKIIFDVYYFFNEC